MMIYRGPTRKVDKATMGTPAKGLFSKLRKQREPEPEPELAPHRLAALRVRAATAEDPDFIDPDEAAVHGESSPRGPGAQPIALVRRARQVGESWGDAESWFGGLPKLGAIEWPRGGAGRPLPFVAQIGLSGVSGLRPDSPLPSGGSLAFFLGEGAVVHVPEGASQFSPAPEDIAPAYEEGGYPFPDGPTALSRVLFPYWPVDPLALTLPEDLRDPSEEARHDDIREAMATAVAAEVPRRRYNFGASGLPEGTWGGPTPVWWHGVDHFIEQLRLSLAQSAEMAGRHGDRPEKLAAIETQSGGLPALVNALEGFAEDRDPWTTLNEEERDVFAEALANAWQQFPDLMRYPAPRRIEDLATVSLRAMMTGDDDAFAALPEGVRELLNRDYRLPAHGLPQMFGLATCIQNALYSHLDDVLLLQLPYDDLMEWRFGDNGAYQFWIRPEDLAERRWDAVKLTFECH